MQLFNGFASKAKAMIYGGGCLFEKMGSPYKALVAFTDVVKDVKDGQGYTEAKMNGFPEAATGDGEKYEG